MRLRLNGAELAALEAYIDADPDCERLSKREAVLDSYDSHPPFSINFVFVGNGIGIDGAFELNYSEADDGWYLGERIDSAERVRELLSQLGALGRA